jgi:hypothetical protein
MREYLELPFNLINELAEMRSNRPKRRASPA